MDAWIGLLGTLVGACATGVGILIRDRYQTLREDKKERRQLLLSKYEELYKELSDVAAFASQTSMQMGFEAGYSGKFDAKKITTSLAASKLQMNVLFYAPELRQEVEAVNNKLVAVSRATTEFILKVDATREEKGKLAGEGLIASTELAGLVLEAQRKLAELAQKQINA